MSRPEAYKGNDPYIFVSYCHKDDARVWPVIEGLQKRGMRVWYDEGIEWGSHWDEVIFEHLSGCACVVAFVTNNFLQSENCKDEISYAKDEQKGPFIVFLDNLELTGMMKYRYGRLQALNLSQFDSVDTLLDTLSSTQTLRSCRGTAVCPAMQSTTSYQTQRTPVVNPEMAYSKSQEYYNNKNYTEAFEWARKAAEQGHAHAQWRVGACYFYGEGTAKNQVEGAKWSRKSAEQGDATAQLFLAYCYDGGDGVEKNYYEAAKWFRRAADQGERGAQESMGDYFRDGKGVVQDRNEAIKWYRLAAMQGSVMAPYKLQQMGVFW